MKELPLEVALLTMVGVDKAVARETQDASVALLDWNELHDELELVMEPSVSSMDLFNYTDHSSVTTGMWVRQLVWGSWYKVDRSAHTGILIYM